MASYKIWMQTYWNRLAFCQARIPHLADVVNYSNIKRDESHVSYLLDYKLVQSRPVLVQTVALSILTNSITHYTSSSAPQSAHPTEADMVARVSDGGTNSPTIKIKLYT